MKYFLLIVLSSFLVSCKKLPPEYSRAPHRSLIQSSSKNQNGVEIKIHAVNKSFPLHVRAYKLGNKVWLPPGEHKIILSCSLPEYMGKKVLHKKVTLTVESGYNYLLTATGSDENFLIEVVSTRQ